MLSALSTSRLAGVHQDLARVIKEASEGFAFIVTEGLRTKERQRQLVSTGASRTMNSRHITGHAVDLCVLNKDGSANWDFANYKKLADHVKAVAVLCDVPLEWGGDWRSFKDGPHFQLPFAKYP